MLGSSQAVRHSALNRIYAGSIPASPVVMADIAQSVERQVVTLYVAGSIPAVRPEYYE